jgi:GDP-D-mannose dehydratase
VVDPARLRSSDVRYLVGDPTAIRRDTGWMPGIDLQQTLEEILEEWRDLVGKGRGTRGSTNR